MFTGSAYRKVACAASAAVCVVAVAPLSAAAAPAAAPADVTPVTASDTQSSASPVGSWSLKVNVDGSVTKTTIYFTPTGNTFLGFGGSGRWASKGGNTFAFTAKEPMIADDGTYLGYVDINQKAVLKGNTFVSTGTSTVYGPDDKLIRTAEAKDEGTRF